MMNLNNLQKIIVIGIIGILLIPMASLCAEEKKPTKAANVNGKIIAYKDFERQLILTQQQMFRGRSGQLPENVLQQVRNQVMNQLIAEELLYQESKRKGIKIGPEVAKNEVEKIKKRFESVEQYQRNLERMQLTEDELKGQISQRAAIRALIDQEITSKIKVTEADAKAYFDANPEKFRQPERVRAQHILIKVDKDADEKHKAQSRKTLTDIKKRILGGEDFAALAKEFSQGPSSSKGGDLGYFTKDRMVPPFAEAAFNLAVNEVSDIVETRFGYHLIKVLDRKAEKDLTFKETKLQIMAGLRKERIQKQMGPYVEELRKNAKIESFIK